MILKILHALPYYAESETIEIAKGKHKIPQTFVEGFELSKIQELKDAETKKIADKESANAKLKALGLTDDEIEAFKS